MTCIINSITACSIRLAVIFSIMSISTFKTAVILCLRWSSEQYFSYYHDEDKFTNKKLCR